MALIKCYECNADISTDAKYCPHCGAKNKAYRTSKIKLFILSFFAIIIFFTIYNTYGYKLIPTIPECNSIRAEKVFTDMIEKTPWAKNNYIKVLNIINVKELHHKQNSQKCEVTVHLSNTKNKSYIVSFNKQKDKGGYLVRVSPK